VIFHELSVVGAFVIELERQIDDRGFFARTFCTRAFGEQALEPAVAQASYSHNELRGTLRGMHFQRAPHEETKVVRCTRGAVHDVIVDLRRDSPSYQQFAAAELSADNSLEIFVPAGCAHGFLTLEDYTEVEYLISTHYVASASAGIRWDDPTIGIEWPFAPVVMSERDRDLPLFTP
jgi:dTDP-4-dehydrorhamnose 3,5-epimerase